VNGVSLWRVVFREDIEDFAQRYRRLRELEHRGCDGTLGRYAFPILRLMSVGPDTLAARH
jgi:hypothetical protein